MWYIIDKNSKGVTTMRKELLKGLTDEQLEAVSGGFALKPRKCPECGSSDVELCDTAKLKCNKCGKRWKI